MVKSIKEAFTSDGVFLHKNISLHFTLQKGRENRQKLGSFCLDLEERGNVARKLAFFLFLALTIFCFFRKKQKTSQKTLDKSTKKM